MALFACPHCNAICELLGDAPRVCHDAPACECGSVMEPLHLAEQLGPALDLSDPVQRDQAIRGMLT